MKIVSREEFLKLPENTVYCEYEPCVVNGFAIKMESLPNNWIVQDLEMPLACNSSEEFRDVLDKALDEGVSFDMDYDSCGRDGCFENDQLYMVYEESDVQALINRLSECLPKG